MVKDPLISVIIPCYNYGRYLRESVESLLVQTETDWECLIINDGSTDATEQVALKLASEDNRIKYFFQTNSGPSAARNLGLQKARGIYIQFLDADDLLSKNKLRYHSSILNNRPEIDLVYGGVKVFQKNDGERGEADFTYFTKQKSGKGKDILGELVKDSMFLINTPLFRKSLIEKTGLFNTKISRHEDWHLWIRGALKGAYYQYDNNSHGQVLVRAHENSLTGSKEGMWREKIKARMDLNNFAVISDLFIDHEIKMEFIRQNKYLLCIDRYKYEVYFGNVLKGFVICLDAILKSGKFYSHSYEALYWLKERIKR